MEDKNKGKIYCTMPDKTERWLTEIKPFINLRGKENKDKVMGIAKDDHGSKYVIKVAACSLPTCYCAAKAESIES